MGLKSPPFITFIWSMRGLLTCSLSLSPLPVNIFKVMQDHPLSSWSPFLTRPPEMSSHCSSSSAPHLPPPLRFSRLGQGSLPSLVPPPLEHHSVTRSRALCLGQLFTAQEWLCLSKDH